MLRGLRETDVGLVIDSWAESYHDGSLDLRGVRHSYYRQPMRTRISDLLRGSHVVVAADAEDSDHVLGWACAERRGPVLALHYVYVVLTRRGHGLAGLLSRAALEAVGGAPDARWRYTHTTYLGTRIARRDGHGGEYDPCLLWARRETAE